MLPAQEQIYGCHSNNLGAMTFKCAKMEKKKRKSFSLDSTE